MFDQSYGLRFDIYERIILAEDLPGIDELEEAELIPHIQVINQQDQATLRGHLLLAGLYKGDTEEGETEPLEHWIPVEITVPMNRVSSLDDIAVEIENFDVDLLSKRSLNITGVLSLKGIQAAAPGPKDPEWTNEEFTVVHAPETPGFRSNGDQQNETNLYEQQQGDRVGADVRSDTSSDFSENSTVGHEGEEEARTQQYLASWSQYENHTRDPEHAEVTEDIEGEAGSDQLDQSKSTASFLDVPESKSSFEYALHKEADTQNTEPSIPSVWQFERTQDQSEALLEKPAGDVPGSVQRKDEEAEALPIPESGVKEEAESLVAEGTTTGETEPGETSMKTDEIPAKPELKVALSTKNSSLTSTSSVGFSSLLQSSRTVQDQDQAIRDDEVETEEFSEPALTEDVEWKSLFLGSRREETPFRKVRMCIVQREETIDLIAERYQLTPRELLLYNRMSEQTVEEGQVLYIPQ